MIKTINQKVAITALYFQNKKRLQEYPRRMEWAGESFIFNSGLSCSVKKGDSLVRIFTMTDGRTDYRLRFDEHAGLWTLLGVSS